MNRSGIALVLVLVVLAALLLLGVPFLASQSASLSGSRQLSQRTQAALSRDAAEGRGIAVAVATIADGTYDLSRSASATALGDNRFLVRTAALPSSAQSATHGSAGHAVVEDESGKLDAATLGEEGWARLLAAVGVTDWFGSPRWRWFDEAEGAARYAAGTLDRDASGYEVYGEWTNEQAQGQLARTLAQAGLQLPATGYRLAHLDQLLGVDPARVPALNPYIPAMRIDNPASWEYGRRDPHFAARQWSGLTPPPDWHRVPNPTVSNVRRKGLSRAELDLLRPHLTVHAPAQARAGMVDVGTVLGNFDTDPGPGKDIVTVLDAGSYPRDQWLAGERPLSTDPTRGEVAIVESDGSGRAIVRGANYSTQPELSRTDEGIAFMLPPTVNPNTAGDAVLRTLVRTATAAAVRVADLRPLSRSDGTAVIDPDADPPVSPAVRGPLHPAEHPGSAGVVTVESHGAGLDGAARRTAGEDRRLVVQVADQEQGAARRWNTQADWWALAANRQVANLIAAPLAGRTSGSPRLVEAILDPTGPLGEFHQPGRLIGGPLSPFSMNRGWSASWRVDFGFLEPVPATRADAPWPTNNDNRTDTSGSQVQLLADGARLTGAGIAGYLLPTGQTPTPLAPRQSVGSATEDATGLGPSWLSLHVRFDDPATPTTLLASRTPVNGSATSTLGVEISGAAASNDSQHRWELLYDADAGLLRLVVANGAIPASGTTGLQAGWDDPATELIDERALGSEAPDAMDLAQRDPIGAVGAPIAAPELRVRFTPVRDRWYHLLIVQVHDQPGGTVILIDGLLGQDWGATGEFANQGDYVTLPSLRLRDALPAVDASIAGGKALAVPRIALDAPPGVAIADLLPARGLVRIHDEYIAYGRLSGDALEDCIRARRVNTNITNSNQEWPLTQDHAAGSRVLPGWFSQRLSQAGRLLTGVNRLAIDLGGGDFDTTYPTPLTVGWSGPTLSNTYHSDDALALTATPANLKYRTWSWLQAPTTVNPGGSRTLTIGGSLTLPPKPDIDAWPRRGQVRFLRFTGTGVADIGDRWFTRSGSTLSFPGQSNITDTVPADEAVFALVTSIEVDDPIIDFPTGTDQKAFQILDPGGRCEWIRYDQATTPGTIEGHYFVHNLGFPFVRDSQKTARGSMRTAFVANMAFPRGSLVLPVQTHDAGVSIRGLEPGDTVTLMPTGRWTPDLRPVQVHVRFAASDGFAWDPPAQPRFDTNNRWFALTAPISLSASMSSSNLSAVVGRGWSSARTLSTSDFDMYRTGFMPRIEAFGDGFAGFGDPQWGPRTTLGPDRDRGSPWTTVSGFQLDTVGAGSLGNGLDGLRANGFGISSLGGGTQDAIPASGGLPVSATAEGSIFARRTGLVLIDGEVFAYRRPREDRQNEAILIARGLLGTRSVEHSLARSTRYGGKQADGILPAIHLPIGPIGILGDRTGLGAVNDGPDYGNPELPADAPTGHSIRVGPTGEDLFPGSGDGEYQAPAFVISDPYGREVEAAVLLPDPVRKIIVTVGGSRLERDLPGKALAAPWLRGMWGTEPRDWQGGLGDGRNPVIIPWWPRHASALPATLPSEARVLSAMLRSRRYQWAGPAARLRGMRVDRGPVGHAFTTVPAPGGLSRPELRGFAPRAGATPAQLFDWSTAIPLPDTGGVWSGGPTDEVDGAEYRHHLVYLRSEPRWSMVPDAAAERLEITTGEIRVAAPVRVLASEAGR